MANSSDKKLAKPELTEAKTGSKSGKQIKVPPKKDNEKGLAAGTSAQAEKEPKK